ncbi:putative lipid II flippase FtsW [Desulfonatronum sp. SC1]|uniref:putative lipid II flippase FtsW n=1 Tax=Desulfonatronum sp. SC1 TaxID=2109626 RepID=UPI000D2F5265|nr:putative lipid II flippase FtsW [Desulfonatronum sp. SC1]PTN33075.1 putative lipid II flippase FtsW [Desulfonatronum sp. SC1]
MSRLAAVSARGSGAGRGEGVDFWLLSVALLLSGLGLVMVLSSTGIMAERFYADKYYFFKRHLVFLIIGLGVMSAAAALPRLLYLRFAYAWLALAGGLLLLTLVSPLGVQAGGATRWLSVGPIMVQPLEISKVALVLYLASFFSRKQEMIRTFGVGFLPPVCITGALCVLLLAQPDFGGAASLMLILFCMSFVGGTRLVYLGATSFMALMGGIFLVMSSPYRFRRWFAFLDPFQDAQDVGYQLVQSLYALGGGGWLGEGLGAGKQKLFFLPAAHTDFILAVIGEELGFVGVSVIFVLVGVLLWRGLRIAKLQDGLQERFVAFGMLLILALGAMLNIAVVLGVVPPKGVPMPFLSYGGSSLVISLFCVGVLLNLSRSATPLGSGRNGAMA